MAGVLLGDQVAAVAAAIEFLPGETDLVTPRAHRGAVAHVGRVAMGVEAPIGHVDDAVLVEHAVTLRAVDALNHELLAREQALRLGATDRALGDAGEAATRAEETTANKARIVRTGFAILTPLNRTRVNYATVDSICIIAHDMPRLF